MTKNADFEKLNFDEGFGYEGEISINFFGKNMNVDKKRAAALFIILIMVLSGVASFMLLVL